MSLIRTLNLCAFCQIVIAQANDVGDRPAYTSNSAETQWWLPVVPPYSRINVVLLGKDSQQFGPFASDILPGWTPASPRSKAPGRSDADQYQPIQVIEGLQTPPLHPFDEAAYYPQAINYGLSNSSNAPHQAWLPTSAEGLIVGRNANMTTSHWPSNNASAYRWQDVLNTTWPSLPYGLTLGGLYSNGSLVFGGSYDWSRVNDTKWHKLPNNSGCMTTSEDYSCIWGPNDLRVGAPMANDTTKSQFTLGYHKFQLASGYTGADCSSAVNMTVAGARLDFSTELLQTYAQGGGVLCDDKTALDRNILGWPFFMAAYVYVDVDESVYIARALESNATSDIRPFNPSATIESHPAVRYTPSSSTTSDHASGANSGKPSGVMLLRLALVSLASACVLYA